MQHTTHTHPYTYTPFFPPIYWNFFFHPCKISKQCAPDGSDRRSFSAGLMAWSRCSCHRVHCLISRKFFILSLKGKSSLHVISVHFFPRSDQQSGHRWQSLDNLLTEIRKPPRLFQGKNCRGRNSINNKGTGQFPHLPPPTNTTKGIQTQWNEARLYGVNVKCPA